MSREAMQQALEALEQWKGITNLIPGSAAYAIIVLKQALAETEQEPVAIKWTLNGDKHCGYSNWLGETPFGRILITWKSWKDLSDACVDEFPGGFWAYGEPDEVKAQCEAEFCRRLGTAPTPRKPLTDEEIVDIWADVSMDYDDEINIIELARALERAHGIGEQHE